MKNYYHQHQPIVFLEDEELDVFSNDLDFEVEEDNFEKPELLLEYNIFLKKMKCCLLILTERCSEGKLFLKTIIKMLLLPNLSD